MVEQLRFGFASLNEHLYWAVQKNSTAPIYISLFFINLFFFLILHLLCKTNDVNNQQHCLGTQKMIRNKKKTFFENINLNVRGLGQSATLAINEDSNKLKKRGIDVYKLGLGQSPFPVPEHVVEALRQNAHQKDYLPVQGLHELRKTISSYLQTTQSLDFHHTNIIIGPGSKELIFILQLAYYGDLIIPTPSWVSYSPQAQIVGRHVH